MRRLALVALAVIALASCASGSAEGTVRDWHACQADVEAADKGIREAQDAFQRGSFAAGMEYLRIVRETILADAAEVCATP